MQRSANSLAGKKRLANATAAATAKRVYAAAIQAAVPIGANTTATPLRALGAELVSPRPTVLPIDADAAGAAIAMAAAGMLASEV